MTADDVLEQQGPGAVDDPDEGGPEAGVDGVEVPTRRKGEIPPALLDPDAVRVVRRLQSYDHEAYLVGGCVRDLLSGLEPKDFDVATDARPNRIKRLFRNARIIGRRFRLAHIRFGPDHVIETSTFRADPAYPTPPNDAAGRNAAPLHGHRTDEREERADDDPTPDRRGRRRPPLDAENLFGTAPEDARRRDFTINALFYDPSTDEILDWVGGLADLEARVVRSIGTPAVRIHEDPVRMIRAVHFAERMGFEIEDELESAISNHARQLEEASPARLYIELLKVLTRGRARPTLRRLFDLGVLAAWLPELVAQFETPASWPDEDGGTHDEASRGEPEDAPPTHATWNLLGAADRWGMAAHGAEDALALAPLFAAWVAGAWRDSGRRGFVAFAEVFDEVVRPMAVRMSMPRRTSGRLRDLLWLWLQMRHAPEGRRSARLLRRPLFALALTFLRLDMWSRDQAPDLFDAWETLAQEQGITLDPAEEARRSREQRPTRRRGGRGGRGGRDPRRSSPAPVSQEADAWREAPPATGEAPASGDDAPRGPGRRRRGRRRRRRPPDANPA